MGLRAEGPFRKNNTILLRGKRVKGLGTTVSKVTAFLGGAALAFGAVLLAVAITMHTATRTLKAELARVKDEP